MQYKLVDWVISVEQNLISNDSESRHLDNKSMQVLLLLIKNAGNQVTKEQLFTTVWKDKIVSDDILSVAVSNIRKKLGDNARKTIYIKTIPSIGYCLIADVEEIEKKESISVEPKIENVAQPKNHLRYIIAVLLILISINCVQRLSGANSSK